MRIIAGSLIAAVCLLSADAKGQECSLPEACYGSPELCCRCGSHSPCTKYCLVIRKTKKVSERRWDCRREEFCVPCPRFESLWSCFRLPFGLGKADCGETLRNGSDRAQGQHEPPPDCAQILSRKKLMMAEYTTEVPVYKYVVQYCCPNCHPAHSGDSEETITTPAQSMPSPLRRVSAGTLGLHPLAGAHRAD